MNIDTGGGGAVGGNVSSGPSTLHVNFDRDAPMTDRERVEWRDRQFVEFRYALIGDKTYGITGLVDTVYSQRIWLIILTALVAMVAFILIWQGFQIYQMFQILEQLQRAAV